MKITKTLLTVTAAAAFMSLQALAGDTQLNMVSNNHGQSTPLYRGAETNVAVYTGGAGAGGNAAASNNCACPQLTSRDSGHGQQILLFR